MNKRINLDSKWRFLQGDFEPRTSVDGWAGAKARGFDFGASAKGFDDKNWREVDVPHDFVSEGDYTRKSADRDMTKIPLMETIDSRHVAGGSLEGSIAWYRKHFTLAEKTGKRFFLHFDGVYRNSSVYLNEYFVGNHDSGYTSFFYDVTDFINEEGDNLLAVRVDATGREGWWYEGGGIYRHVYLVVKDEVYIEPWGVFVNPHVDVDENEAVIDIQTEITSRSVYDKVCDVISVIKDKSGNTVATCKDKQSVRAWETTKYSHKTTLKNPILWDIENPYLYTLETEVYEEGELIEKAETKFGIRNIRFDCDKGFFLNGRNVKIKGLCCHHDHAGVGIGMTESIIRYRLEEMQKMGMNAYRSAHHPPTPELLDMCDEMGILVLDETRRMTSCNTDLEALCSMVKRDRNHPSVFLWGIGNEEIGTQDRIETIKTTTTMKMAIKKLDPSRAVTSAVVAWNGRQFFDNARHYIPVTKHLDVMGFNYSTVCWDDYHENVPHQSVIITEATTNSGTRGCYGTDALRGHYDINDPKNEGRAMRHDKGETEWKMCAERDYMAGLFLWTGVDYRGEPTPFSYPALYSQFGILDYCGFRKDNFYYYKSWWTNEDVLHIFPHWNFIGREGEVIRIGCYSNCDEVELFVNGKTLGKKQMEKNWYLVWDAVYERGEVLAVGYKNEKEVCRKIVKTTLSPYKVVLEPYKDTVSSGETAIIKVLIKDENGEIHPTADNLVKFNLPENATLVGVGNGDPGSFESEKYPFRRAFNGMCMLLVKCEEKGEIEITATSEGLYKGECRIKIQ